MLLGMWAGILVYLTLSCISKGEREYKTKLIKALSSSKTGKIAGAEKTVKEDGAQEKGIPEKAVKEVAVQESTAQKEAVPKDVFIREEVVSKEVWVKDIRLYVALPILCIGIAELLIFTADIQQLYGFTLRFS